MLGLLFVRQCKYTTFSKYMTFCHLKLTFCHLKIEVGSTLCVGYVCGIASSRPRFYDVPFEPWLTCVGVVAAALRRGYVRGEVPLPQRVWDGQPRFTRNFIFLTSPLLLLHSFSGWVRGGDNLTPLETTNDIVPQ